MAEMEWNMLEPSQCHVSVWNYLRLDWWISLWIDSFKHAKTVLEYFYLKDKDRAMNKSHPNASRIATFSLWHENKLLKFNPLMPNDPYSGRTAPLTSKRCILYIYSTNIGTEYFKHGIYSPFLSLQNAVCFIILTYLVPVLFTFYIQVC